MRVVYLLVLSVLFAGSPATASISSTMIVEMREITSVSVSPSGQLAVVGICHANPRTNKRELSWVVVPLREGGTLKVVPAGEEIYDPSAPGALLSRQAQWSSDSKWFFYLRRDGEEVQLWETRADGRTTRQVTSSKSDLIDLKRSSEPDVFIVQLAPDREALRQAEQDENRSGILYDDHVIGAFPLTRTLPVIDRWRNVRRTDNGEYVPPGWSGRTTAFFDVRSHNLWAVDGLAPKALAPAAENGTNMVSIVALNPIPKNSSDYAGQYTLQLEPKTAEHPKLKCELAECVANRITIIGWSPDGAEIYYLADSLQDPRGVSFPKGAAIYAWNPHRNVVRLIHESGGGLWGRLYNLDGIAGLSLEPNPLAGREIVFAFAGADEPPRLEAINLDSGVSRILFDPNAELRSLTQGRAVWHTWETSTGYRGRGIMFLPDDYRPGKTYPAVITTYACGNGFLRGGSGDNAPEYMLANHGFIAVCVNVPVSEILTRETDQGRIYPVYCDIILGLIADLTKYGKLDPTRVGLSGQSLGANAGAYCISHSNAIAAAAFRHGSYPELARWELFDTSAAARGPSGVYARLGLPDPRNDPTGKWDQMSVSHHAVDINAPTLLQLDDLEHLGALPLWSAMRDEGKAVEMYVFPEDGHALMQPIHMLVNFERQLDWFRFWLKSEEDMTLDKRAQYDRWNRLREMKGNSRPQH
jgi:dipeptidyl aminopeptidase/acylaminoacyl peptidase